MDMQPSSFLRFAAICCFVTVVTTLGIHQFFPDAPADFEQRALLYKNFTYLLNRWWVILHCLLVIISMWGFALVQMKKAPGLTGLGFLFFAVFGIAEITRQMFVLFYVNELREQYSLATEPAAKEALKNALTYTVSISSSLFGVFILSFALGNLFYGLSLTGRTGFDRWLSLLLVVWSAGSFLALTNSFWKSDILSIFLEKYNFTFQPFMRLLIGVWLWRKAREWKRVASLKIK